jgi:hypothetical protein
VRGQVLSCCLLNAPDFPVPYISIPESGKKIEKACYQACPARLVGCA